MFIVNFIKKNFEFLFSLVTLQKRKANIILLGLDNAGKTSLLRMIKEDRFVQMPPTYSPHSEEIKVGNISFRSTDLGGHEAARRIWKNYYENIDGIIYMHDSQEKDQQKVQTSRQELSKIISDPKLENVPIVVLGNKIDILGARSEENVRAELGLNDFNFIQNRHIQLFMCSVAKKMGYIEGFQWLENIIKDGNKKQQNSNNKFVKPQNI